MNRRGRSNCAGRHLHFPRAEWWGRGSYSSAGAQGSHTATQLGPPGPNPTWGNQNLYKVPLGTPEPSSPH